MQAAVVKADYEPDRLDDDMIHNDLQPVVLSTALWL